LPPLEDDGFVPLDGSEPKRGQQPAGKRPPPVPAEVSAAALHAAAGVVPLPQAPRTEPIDPNLLPPPPPRKKEKVTHVPVVCRLCGTRMHAPLEKIGQTLQCPDCHTVNEIKPLKVREEKKIPKGPSLDNAEEFGLDVTVERPAYRPLQAPRGDYAILAAMDPDSAPPGWQPPDPRAPPVAAAASAAPAARASAPVAEAEPAGTSEAEPAPESAAPEYGEVEEEEDFVISEPVERIEYKPPPPRLPPPEPNAEMYDGRYSDDHFGTEIDRGAAGAWRRAPFRVGVIEFLFHRDALLRWILYGMGAAALVALANAARPSETDDLVAKALEQGQQYVYAFLFGLGFMAWVAPFSCCLFAIVEDTANGSDQVTSWPDYNILEWFLKASYFPVAGIVAGFPGLVFGSFIVSTGAAPVFALPLVILASWVFLFPLVLSSMLAESSVVAFYSPSTYRSLSVAADSWLIFYLLQILLGFLAALALVLAQVRFFPVSSVGAAALVVLAFLFCRLMGRMMWIAQEKLAKAPAAESED